MSVTVVAPNILLTEGLSTGIGWRAQVHPKTHPVSEYEFEVVIGGDGRRNTLEGNGSCCVRCGELSTAHT